MTEYTENPGIPYEGIKWSYERWEKKGIIIPSEQRRIYETLGRIYQGKTAVDVGSSIGVGSNILSHTLLGVWGIDLEPSLVNFANALFASPRLKFDQMDILNPGNRPHITFEVVAMLEVIEHLPRDRWDLAMQNLKTFFRPGTVGFISTPNRSAPEINDEHPNNTAHTYEATASELYEFLTKHFEAVTMYSVAKLNNLSQEETCDGNSVETPLLIKIERPINV